MDNQIAQPKILVQRFTLMAIAVVLAIVTCAFTAYLYQTSDPYIQSVLSVEGDRARGHAIFQINCAGCHGLLGDGKVGPSLHHISRRKSELGLIHQVVSGKTPPMPKFQPSPKDMADLLEYLQEL